MHRNQRSTTLITLIALTFILATVIGLVLPISATTQLLPTGLLAQPASAAPGGPYFSVSPQPLALTEPELMNPMRGFYRWLGNENVPLPRKSYDAYDRFVWRDLEPARDQYDFSVLEQDIAKAASEGRRFSFRIRAVVSTKGNNVPDYMVDLMEKGWWHDYNKDGTKDTYVPDWNDPDFMDRVGKLVAALGRQYNNDPRVGWIDIGIFGNWGEWHMASFPYPAPNGSLNMSSANRRQIVDMHVAAFPDKQLVMPSDDERTLLYALNLSPEIGWRRDSLGVTHFEKVRKDTASWAVLENRWKTAPVITEFINPSQQTIPAAYELAKDQVQRYHVSMVSNGNTKKWGILTDAQRAALNDIGKASGYRYQLDRFSLNEQAGPGRLVTIATTWRNLGAAPTYDPWQVVVQLRGADGRLAWEHPLGLDLGSVLPEAVSGSVDWSEQVLIPPWLAEGDYTLSLLVRDPAKYWQPLALSIAGRQADGSYTMGVTNLSRAGGGTSEVETLYLPMLVR